MAPVPGIRHRAPTRMYDVQAIGLGIMGGLPTRTNYLSRIGDFDLDARAAEAIVAEMIGAMRPWRRRFAEWGVPEPTIRRLERAFSGRSATIPRAKRGWDRTSHDGDRPEALSIGVPQAEL